MLTVTLGPDVAEQADRLAHETQTTLEEFVDAALRAYLDQFEQTKINAEYQAFEQQKAALLDRYRGEYVAMHQGQIIDHGPNLRELHLRVFARLGDVPVLLKRVTDEPERELVFRSPHVERG